ncbi:MAG: DUF1571 domain-containing protein [Desulfuromonadales bacterium]|nr:DUF1571 domain-containing protein [Desulfuromonadales bacterium]
MKKLILFIQIVSLFLFVIVAQAGEPDVDSLLKSSVKAYSRLNDLVCLLDKKELVHGTIRVDNDVLFKYCKPGSFYMKVQEGENKGAEMIYVSGKYDNELQVHLGARLGFFKTSINPKGYWALRNNRHPMMDADIGHLLDLALSNYKKSLNDPSASFVLAGKPVVNGMNTYWLQAKFPKDKGYYAHIIDLYIDQKTMLPVKIMAFDWDNKFLEEYSYHNIKLNVGLTPHDFDVNNPAYKF